MSLLPRHNVVYTAIPKVPAVIWLGSRFVEKSGSSGKYITSIQCYDFGLSATSVQSWEIEYRVS